MCPQIANVEEARAWDGEQGAHWARYEDHFNASVRRYTPILLTAAGISASDRVLDIGCGCGETTRRAARAASSGSALGVDLSSQMLERARDRSRSEALANVSFVQADAQVYPFEERSLDVAISRFGAMFFGDPVAAFRNIGRGLRPGGQLALIVWQALRDNEWLQLIRSSLAMGRRLPEPPANAPGPFGLADQGHARAILGSAGFTGINFEPLREPMFFGEDAGEAFAFFDGTGMTHGIIKDLDEAAKAQALERLKDMLTEHEKAEGVLLGSSAWLITARRP